MNRRTFLAALGIAPVVAVAKPVAPPRLIATLAYRLHGNSTAKLDILGASRERSIAMHGFGSARSLGGGIALALSDKEVSALHLFLRSDAFNCAAGHETTVAEGIADGIDGMLAIKGRPAFSGKILRITRAKSA